MFVGEKHSMMGQLPWKQRSHFTRSDKQVLVAFVQVFAVSCSLTALFHSRTNLICNEFHEVEVPLYFLIT